MKFGVNMKITKRQLRKIIKEVAADPRDHAKTNMVDALDIGARQVLGKYIMATGVGEMVGMGASFLPGGANNALNPG